MTKLDAILNQYKKTITRFEDALNQEKNEFIRDSAIQRFEFTFDISWKTIKTYLEDTAGIICTSPKGCFRDAYKQGLIEYDDFWIEMTNARNLTAHTYNEETAEKIYNLLPKALDHFKDLLKNIENNQL